jgi:hypothetical protein
MIIDCDRCVVRGDACHDCVVGVFLGVPGVVEGPAEGSDMPPGARAMQLDAPECRALSVLADQGLVPRLRLVATEPRAGSPTTSMGGTFSDVG